MAHYLYNCPEYLESMFAAFKAGLVPVNTNYRYVDDELVYLWDNADAVAVVFHGTFADRIERIRDRAPEGAHAGCGSTTSRDPCPTGPMPYETAAATADRPGRCGRLGAGRGRPLPALHRRHDRACPRA